MRLEIIVFLIALAIFLYIKFGGKIAIPKLGGTGKFLGSIAGRDKIGTTFLFCLFLLTLSYAIGGREEWKDSLEWWYGSKIFLPSVIAVIVTILFVDTAWRKKVNNALIFTTGVMIFISLLIVATGWGGGDGNGDHNTAGGNSAPPSAPQKQKVFAVEVEKTKKETVFAEYGKYTEVVLPPPDKLVKVRWEFPSEYNGRCLAFIVREGSSGEEIFPCERPPKGLKRVTRLRFSSDDQMEAIPVEVKITYLELEER